MGLGTTGNVCSTLKKFISIFADNNIILWAASLLWKK